MPRKPKSAEEKNTRLRIAAYLRVQWEEFQRVKKDGTQREFADMLDLHESTVSKILAGRTPDAGLDVALALNRKLRVSAEYLLNKDPPIRYFQGVEIDGRIRRHIDQRRSAGR